MAIGDAVEDITTVSGGATATVSVPSGETWVLSSTSVTGIGSAASGVQRTDGVTDTETVFDGNVGEHLTQRPVFSSHDPEYNNSQCSSFNVSFSGRIV